MYSEQQELCQLAERDENTHQIIFTSSAWKGGAGQGRVGWVVNFTSYTTTKSVFIVVSYSYYCTNKHSKHNNEREVP